MHDCKIFARRAISAGPDMPMYHHPHLLGSYLPIHPFADEMALLARLQLTLDACRVTDAYWQYDNDVLFVETVVADVSTRPPEVYARYRSLHDRDRNIMAVILAPSITRSQFESVLVQVATSGVFDSRHPVPLTTEFMRLGA